MNAKALILCLACTVALAAETGAELFQKAVVQERAAGNLEEAIKIYQRVAREFAKDRPLTAKALMQAARCYEKLGQDKAVKLYEQVARDFGDQRDQVAAARERLAALTGGAKAKGGSGMLARQIPVPRTATYAHSDGRHVFFVDYATGGLVAAAMDGTAPRVILPAGGGQRGITGVSVSPDGMQVAVSLEMDDRESFCVVGIDGSGFREVYKKPRRGQQPIGGWSPDGSRFLGQIDEEDGSRSLISISVQDGSARKLKTDKNIAFTASIGGGARFSPDGKYVIFGVQRGNARHRFIHILALDGSYEGGLVEHPSVNRILDFTPDGKHLLFQSDRTGVPAIYALAMANGRPLGEPFLIKQDAGLFAETVSLVRDGTLFYSLGEQERPEVFTVNVDGTGGTKTGGPQALSGPAGMAHLSAAWSPDGQKLAYISTRHRGEDTTLVVRTLTTGQEVEWKMAAALDAITGWAPDGNTIYLVSRYGQSGSESRMEVHSVSPVTGAVRRLAVLPRARVVHSVTAVDGDALLIGFGDSPTRPGPHARMVRYDLQTGQQTDLISKDFASEAVLSPDGKEVAALNRQKGSASVAVKPLLGGEWQTLATLEGTGYMYLQWMPDGAALILGKEGSPDSALLRIPRSGGKPEKIADLPNLQHVHSVRVHPSGRQALFQTLVTRTELWALENFLPKQLASR